MGSRTNACVNAAAAAEALRDEIGRGNDRGLTVKARFAPDGEQAEAEVRAGGEPVFDLPIEIGPQLPAGEPSGEPDPAVEEVKSNVLGWLALAVKEAARLNVEGRYGVADRAMTAIRFAMQDVSQYVC